jgi:hypothetical protein
MHEINYIDKSFNQESASDYSLSLQANARGLIYCICDNISNSIILFRKYRFDHIILLSDLTRNIGNVFASDNTLRLHFAKVKFLGYTRQSTLVPAAFFDEDHRKDYLLFNDEGDGEGIIFNNLISPQHLYNIFSLPSELVTQLTGYFNKVEFLSQATTFLRHISMIPDGLNNPAVYVGINPEFFDIACTVNGKLLLYNTFQYTSETDLLYYILFVYNIMNYKTDKIPLVLSGELSSKLTYLDILKQYITETRCDQDTVMSLLAPDLRQLNTSRFLNLINVHACESSADYIKEGR